MTSSGSPFSVIGIPQLRPMCTRAQTAKASPARSTTRPAMASGKPLAAAWWRRSPSLDRARMTITITTRLRVHRPHRVRPRLTQNAAISQYAQNTAQTPAIIQPTLLTGSTYRQVRRPQSLRGVGHGVAIDVTHLFTK